MPPIKHQYAHPLHPLVRIHHQQARGEAEGEKVQEFLEEQVEFEAGVEGYQKLVPHKTVFNANDDHVEQAQQLQTHKYHLQSRYQTKELALHLKEFLNEILNCAEQDHEQQSNQNQPTVPLNLFNLPDDGLGLQVAVLDLNVGTLHPVEEGQADNQAGQAGYFDYLQVDSPEHKELIQIAIDLKMAFELKVQDADGGGHGHLYYQHRKNQDLGTILQL